MSAVHLAAAFILERKSPNQGHQDMKNNLPGESCSWSRRNSTIHEKKVAPWFKCSGCQRNSSFHEIKGNYSLEKIMYNLSYPLGHLLSC